MQISGLTSRNWNNLNINANKTLLADLEITRDNN
jgi:hypothetical protein